MKEKTFEELIIEKFSENRMIKMSFSRNEMIDIMQQVREATIKECIDKISELHGSIYKGAYQEYLATNLPTDRIRLTENKTQ